MNRLDEAPIPKQQLDQAVFRRVVGHFASGVTVITTSSDDVLFGTTASAVSSLSMEPPMMLVCLNRTSSTHDAIQRAGKFAVNILEVAQRELAGQFGSKGGDKFASVDFSMTPSGLPLLAGALATIECSVADTAAGGTHTIFIGRAVAANAGPGEPLAYYRGQFGALQRSHEELAYVGVREWILRRESQPGGAIDLGTLSDTLAISASAGYNALVRLMAEGLVDRTASGDFTPVAITAEFVDNLYGARQTIEVGVLEAYLSEAPDDLVSAIAQRGRELADREADSSIALDGFLEENLAFHSAIVGLAGSPQLLAQFRQLSIASAWRETYRSPVWREKAGHHLIHRIANAVEAKDAKTARGLIEQQVAFVKATAKDLIGRNGGSI